MQKRDEAVKKPWYKYPPNIMTLFRFMLIVPVAVFYLMDEKVVSLALYLIAGITDILDGYVARKYKFISEWGKAMDPLADKLIVLATILSMFIKGDVSLLIIVLVFSKELIMIIGGVVLYRKANLVYPSNIYGKIGTILFAAAIILTFLNQYTAPWNSYCILLAALFAIFSLLQYAVKIADGVFNGKKP